jgi:hypothetical protein
MTTEREQVDAELQDEHRTSQEDASVCSVPIETEDGTKVICQEPVGAENTIGGGEFPGNPRPPTEPAPGAAGETATDGRDRRGTSRA